MCVRVRSCTCSACDDEVAGEIATSVFAPFMTLTGKCVELNLYNDAVIDAATKLLSADSYFFQKHAIIGRVRDSASTTTTHAIEVVISK